MTFGETTSPSDGNLIPGAQSGAACSWLNKGGPFYVLGLGSNEKLHWTDKIYCGARLQAPDGWKIAPAIPGHDDNPSSFIDHTVYTRIAQVTLHCKVIKGNVQVDFKGFAVPVSPGQASAVDYHNFTQWADDYSSYTQYIYWRYNAPSTPELSRTAFNGNANGEGQDCAVTIDSALPELLDVQFKSLNNDATQAPQDCIVAFYLELVVDEFHMHDYLMNVDGSVSTSAFTVAIDGGNDANNSIGARATILRGNGSPGLPDFGRDPTEKLDDFGKKLNGLKDYLGFDSISKDFGATGDNSALFSVTSLELPGLNVVAGSNSMQTPRIALVDDFTWDSGHLSALGIDVAIKTFRTLMLFVFAYYSVLRFWRAFNH